MAMSHFTNNKVGISRCTKIKVFLRKTICITVGRISRPSETVSELVSAMIIDKQKLSQTHIHDISKANAAEGSGLRITFQ